MSTTQQRSELCQEIKDANFMGSARDGKCFWAASDPTAFRFQMQVIICACCGNYQNVHNLSITDVATTARCYDNEHMRLTQEKVFAAVKCYDEENV